MISDDDIVVMMRIEDDDQGVVIMMMMRFHQVTKIVFVIMIMRSRRVTFFYNCHNCFCRHEVMWRMLGQIPNSRLGKLSRWSSILDWCENYDSQEQITFPLSLSILNIPGRLNIIRSSSYALTTLSWTTSLFFIFEDFLTPFSMSSKTFFLISVCNTYFLP